MEWDAYKTSLGRYELRTQVVRHTRSSDSPTEQVLYVLVGSGGGLSVLALGIGALTSEQLAHPTAYYIAHLHFSALLADTGTHLRVRVDNDRQEHVLEKYRGQ